jgi:subtilisin family serine protease
MAEGAILNWELEQLERRVLLSVMPNDPHYHHQWGLQVTAAEEAWVHTTGDSRAIVGHIDSGIDYTHPDLHRNIWVNQGEIPPHLQGKFRDTDKDGLITFYDLNSRWNRPLVTDVNGNGYIDAGDLLAPVEQGGWADGLDNSRNGYVDDIIGWDFANNDNDPMDRDGHGTHTAGTIGAMGDNGIGVTGVAWKVSMIALKVFPDSGDTASSTHIAAAIRYAADAGAQVTNASWGAYGTSRLIRDAITYAGSKGNVFVAAAGNDGVNNDTSSRRTYPASFDLPNIISVAASNRDGRITSWSNYGRSSVDLAAPGAEILSTSLRGRYAWLSGTSMAVPHVTGTIALLVASNLNLTMAEIQAKIFNGVQKISAMSSRTRLGGELHLSNTMVASRRLPPTIDDNSSDTDLFFPLRPFLPVPRLPWPFG